MKSTSKYRNEKYDGFDSRKEKNRYDELLLMQRAGLISGLKRQVHFELIPAQRINGKVVEKKCEYVCDFQYCDSETGQWVVEDVKSAYTRKNPVYIIKRKLMLYKYGIRIREEV